MQSVLASVGAGPPQRETVVELDAHRVGAEHDAHARGHARCAAQRPGGVGPRGACPSAQRREGRAKVSILRRGRKAASLAQCWRTLRAGGEEAGVDKLVQPEGRPVPQPGDGERRKQAHAAAPVEVAAQRVRRVLLGRLVLRVPCRGKGTWRNASCAGRLARRPPPDCRPATVSSVRGACGPRPRIRKPRTESGPPRKNRSLMRDGSPVNVNNAPARAVALSACAPSRTRVAGLTNPKSDLLHPGATHALLHVPCPRAAGRRRACGARAW